MSKLVAGVTLRPHKVALGAALGSLLAAAGRDLPQAYVMGASGHAFRLVLDLVISPDSPTTLNFHDVLPLWENLGVWLKRVAATPEEPAYAATRAEVIARIKASIDRGLPAASYDLLGGEEYGLVVGYAGDRFACLTQKHPNDPVLMETAAWPPAAHENFTRAEAITVLDAAAEGFDRRRADAAALRFAVSHYWEGTSPDMWLQQGGKAYEFWSRTLEAPLPLHGEEPGRGHAYNLAVLHAARADAAAYLADCAAAYPEAPSLKAAAEAYATVAEHLAEACWRVPELGAGLSDDREARRALARSLAAARAAEERGIDQIERALRALR